MLIVEERDVFIFITRKGVISTQQLKTPFHYY
jgi:hypothetical protein